MNGLKLFTPTEVRTVAEERQGKDVLRAREIQDITETLLKKRNDADASFEAALKEQRFRWEAEEALHFLRKNEALAEVERLEKRKKAILSPLLLEGNDLHTIAEQLSTRELALEEDKKEIIEKARLVMQRLDEVQEQQQNVKNRLIDLKKKETGFKQQHLQALQDIKRASKALSDLYAHQEAFKAEKAFRTSELDSRQAVSKEYELRLEEREKEIANARILINDRQQTLNRGFAELKRKQDAFDNRRIQS